MGFVKIKDASGRLEQAYGDNIPQEDHQIPDGDADHYEFPNRKPRYFLEPGFYPPRPKTEVEKEVERIASLPRQHRKMLADHWRGKLAEMNSGKRTIYTGELLRINRELGLCLDAELIALQRETLKTAAE